MKKVIVYTRSGKVSPSSNYRLLQYVNNFNADVIVRTMSSEYTYKHHANARGKLGKLWWYTLYYCQIQCRLFHFMIKDSYDKPDCVIVQRAISPKFVLLINKFLINKVYSNVNNLIWDFDDEIMNSKEITVFEYNLLTKYSKTIVVTSEFLKSRLDVFAREKTILLPTTDCEFATLDINICLTKKRMTYNNQIELLWLATSPSLPHLYKIIDELDVTAKELSDRLDKELILHVVCNKPLTYDAQYLKIDNVIWSREVAKQMVERSHIGLMPLVNTVSSKGKGGFKIIQYMSAGIPAVASAIGYNKEIIINNETGFLVNDEDDISQWRECILKLSENWERYSCLANASRNEWDKRFSFEDNLFKWNELIN